MKWQSILLVLIVFLLGSCNKSGKYIYNKGFVYGTTYSIIYESPNGKDFQPEIEKEFKKYTMIFSPFEKESTISKINRNIDVEPEPVFITCFKKAMEISEITGGAFDITAGALVNAWGFGPEEKEKMTPEIIDSLMQITGYKKIHLQGNKIVKDIPTIDIDMNAISKGYTSDLIADFLKAKGCKNYMVEIGGEIVAHGKNERGIIWTIGISKPEETPFPSETELQAKLQLNNKAMATSGNYRNFYIENGKKYAHTIDPKTGYPVQHSLLSSTVLAGDCMTADAFATSFMVLGIEKAKEIVNNTPEIEVYFIYAGETGENRIYMSEGFKKYLVE